MTKAQDGGWGASVEVQIEEQVPEADPFNGLHPCIVQICLTQSDRDMEESQTERVSAGYLSDDCNSQKTPLFDYEKSSEHIDVDNVEMQVDHDNLSACFSARAEEEKLDDDGDGNFSSKESEPDSELLEEQSILYEMNRHLDDALTQKMKYEDDKITFSKSLNALVG